MLAAVLSSHSHRNNDAHRATAKAVSAYLVRRRRQTTVIKRCHRDKTAYSKRHCIKPGHGRMAHTAVLVCGRTA